MSAAAAKRPERNGVPDLSDWREVERLHGAEYVHHWLHAGYFYDLRDWPTEPRLDWSFMLLRESKQRKEPDAHQLGLIREFNAWHEPLAFDVLKLRRLTLWFMRKAPSSEDGFRLREIAQKAHARLSGFHLRGTIMDLPPRGGLGMNVIEMLKDTAEQYRQTMEALEKRESELKRYF